MANTYQFDEKGNLFPHQLISIDSLEEFERFFVGDFPLSATRNAIYSGLLTYLSDFGDLLRRVMYEGQWVVWLDGSFTTDKISPADIDVLIILTDAIALQINKPLFEPFFADNAQRTYGVDAYFLLLSESIKAQNLLAYWQKWLGTDRSGFSKGIVELTITI